MRTSSRRSVRCTHEHGMRREVRSLSAESCPSLGCDPRRDSPRAERTAQAHAAERAPIGGSPRTRLRSWCMRDSPRLESFPRSVEHGQARSRTDLPRKLEKLVRLVRVALLWRRESNLRTLHERCEARNLSEENVLRVEHPPERLRGRLDPREKAFVSNAPRRKQLKPGWQELVRYPEVDVGAARVRQPLDRKLPDLIESHRRVVHRLGLDGPPLENDLLDGPRRVDHDRAEGAIREARRLYRFGWLRSVGFAGETEDRRTRLLLLPLFTRLFQPRLELPFFDGREPPRLVGEVLVDPHVGKWNAGRIRTRILASAPDTLLPAASRQPPALLARERLLRGDQLPKPARRALDDLDRVELHRHVFRLACVSAHRDALVADSLRLVDADDEAQ